MKYQKGFGLIEIILYVALFSIVFTGAVAMLIDTIKIKEVTWNSNQNVNLLMNLIGRGNYTSSKAETLSEFMDDMEIDPTYFSDMSTQNSNHIKVTYPNFETSWELSLPNLQSRHFLTNLVVAYLTSAGKDLSGISIRNISETQTVEIEQINVEWSGVSGDTRITEIQIGGGNVEWSGSLTSPATIDINNFSLAPKQTAPIDYFRFNTRMNGGYLIINFIMSDGSHIRSELDLLEPEGEGGTDPPPCAEWCITEGEYAYGVCRSSSFWCWLYGGTREPEADDLCTGSSICCCHN